MILPLLTQFPPVQVGALATQIMEFFHCFADEVEYIWQFVKPFSSQHHPLTSPSIQRSDIFRHLPIRMVALLPSHRADVSNPPYQLPSSSSPPPPLQRQPSFHGNSTISFRRRQHLLNGFHNQSSHRPNRNNLHRTNTPGPR